MLWHGWGLAVNREEAIEKVRKIATAPAPLPGEIDLVSKAVELLPEMEAELAKNASSVTKHKDLSTESIKDSPTDVTAIIAPTSDVSIKGEEKKVSSSTQPARTSIKLYDHLTAGEKATFFGSVSVLFLFGIALLYAHKKEQVCTECGTKLPSDVSYCIECGTRIDNQVFESNNMRIGGSCLIGLPILMILALLLTDYALVAVSAMVSCPLPVDQWRGSDFVTFWIKSGILLTISTPLLIIYYYILWGIYSEQDGKKNENLRNATVATFTLFSVALAKRGYAAQSGASGAILGFGLFYFLQALIWGLLAIAPLYAVSWFANSMFC